MVVANPLPYDEEYTLLNNNDFFTLFGLPVGFKIDKIALKNVFLNLQKQHHPDNADNQIYAEQNTTLINHAFNTLNRDDNRAIYLLELAGVAFNSDKTIADESFLMQMMNYRMALEDAIFDNDKNAIGQIASDISTLMNQTATEFNSVYQTKDWESAQIVAQKLKFLGKLHDDMTNALSKTSPHQDNEQDDDLYV